MQTKPDQSTTFEQYLSEARTMGADHGKSAGSWYFDFGRMPGGRAEEIAAAARVLRGIEEGDPEILDTFPAAPLSGEWAGDPTPHSLLSEIVGSSAWDQYLGDEDADEILSAYEDAFYSASVEEIERTARLFS